MGDVNKGTFKKDSEKTSIADMAAILSLESRDRLLAWMEKTVCAVVVSQTGNIEFVTSKLADKLERKAFGLQGMPFAKLQEKKRSTSPFASGEQETGMETCLMETATGQLLQFQVSKISLDFSAETGRSQLYLLDDVSELAAAAAENRRLLNTDNISGLKNREQLQQEIHASVLNREPLSMLLINMDRFKYFNDTLGHTTGDLLLVKIAARLKGMENEVFRLYRCGGDEFAVLLKGIHHSSAAEQYAGRVLALFEKPFLIGQRELVLTASIGMSRFPGPGVTADEVIQQASTAMQSAKDSGKNSYKKFVPSLRSQFDSQMLLEKRLRHALLTGGFHIDYQPQVNLKLQKVVGVEALLRWNDEVLGKISPETFIPVAEETGLIFELGDWVLEEACTEAQGWVRRGYPLRVGVNISPLQFQRPDFVENVQMILKRTGLPPRLLDLEITENDLLYHEKECITTLHRLKAAGIQISIDDFGTGYSSLSYLRQFPIDTLKIDKSFIREVLSNEKDQAIVTSIIQLAHNMNMHVIAEGVETKGMLPFLFERHCDEMQGFLYSKPVSPAKLGEYVNMTKSRELFIS